MSGVPHFYDPRRVGTLFYPDPASIAHAAEQAALAPASEDTEKIHLLLVDMQIDFCHAQGSLYVPGAEEDVRRLCNFIFQHAERISDIVCTLDSHLPFQIFHASWWVDEQGNHPEPLTIIDSHAVQSGRWRPLVMPEYSRNYVKQLEKRAKKKLTIWPYHVLIGGIGNALDPMLFSVVLWHSLARATQSTWMSKGRVPQSEHYSAVQPEIEVPKHPQGQKNVGLLRLVKQADALFLAGEAQSHCVLETVSDFVNEFRDQPDVLQKIYVLKDCMSPVVHPEIDFGAIAEARFADFAELGINFVASTDDVGILSASAKGRDGTEWDGAQVSGLERMAEWERLNMEARGV